MIRSITPEDAEAIIDMMYDLKHESPTYGDVAADEEYVRLNLRYMPSIPSFIGMIDTDYRGFILGGMSATWYSPVLNAHEQLLYVSPQHRGGSVAPRLIKAFVVEADRRGACEVYAGASTGIREERTMRLYEHLGFHREGSTLIRKLR